MNNMRIQQSHLSAQTHARTRIEKDKGRERERKKIYTQNRNRAATINDLMLKKKKSIQRDAQIICDQIYVRARVVFYIA